MFLLKMLCANTEISMQTKLQVWLEEDTAMYKTLSYKFSVSAR